MTKVVVTEGLLAGCEGYIESWSGMFRVGEVAVRVFTDYGQSELVWLLESEFEKITEGEKY